LRPLAPNVLSIGDERDSTSGKIQLGECACPFCSLEFSKANGNEQWIGFPAVTLIRQKHNLASARKDVFAFSGVHARCSPALLPHEGLITSGLLSVLASECVLKTAAELLAEGISLTGLYLVRVREEDDVTSSFQRRYLGRVEQVCRGKAILRIGP